jgi:hypothetical protein
LWASHEVNTLSAQTESFIATSLNLTSVNNPRGPQNITEHTKEIPSQRELLYLRSSGIVPNAEWQFCTDVSGQPTAPIFKGKEVQEENVGTELPFSVGYYPRRTQISSTSRREAETKEDFTSKLSTTQLTSYRNDHMQYKTVE